MNWFRVISRVVLCGVGVGCLGCKGNNKQPSVDPFFRPATIPPPATGTIGAPASTPYSDGTTTYPGSSIGAPAGTSYPAGTNGYSPPGGYAPPGGSFTPNASGTSLPQTSTTPASGNNWSRARPRGEAGDLRLVGGAAEAGNVAANPYVAGGAEPVSEPIGTTASTAMRDDQVRPASHTGDLRIVDSGSTAPSEPSAGSPFDAPPPAATPTAAPPVTAAVRPARLTPAAAPNTARPSSRYSPSVDIMSLPPAGGAQPSTSRRPVSDDAAEAAQRVQARAAEAHRYGYDADYAWLRGQLEYSDIDGRWKLRYIPIDGETDAYGGSVVLADANLEGLRPNDFVTVRGSLSPRAGSAGSFAPVYNVERVRPLNP